jgi:hypothetical protein
MYRCGSRNLKKRGLKSSSTTIVLPFSHLQKLGGAPLLRSDRESLNPADPTTRFALVHVDFRVIGRLSKNQSI